MNASPAFKICPFLAEQILNAGMSWRTCPSLHSSHLMDILVHEMNGVFILLSLSSAISHVIDDIQRILQLSRAAEQHRRLLAVGILKVQGCSKQVSHIILLGVVGKTPHTEIVLSKLGLDRSTFRKLTNGLHTHCNWNQFAS